MTVEHVPVVILRSEACPRCHCGSVVKIFDFGNDTPMIAAQEDERSEV